MMRLRCSAGDLSLLHSARTQQARQQAVTACQVLHFLLFPCKKNVLMPDQAAQSAHNSPERKLAAQVLSKAIVPRHVQPFRTSQGYQPPSWTYLA